MISRPCSSTRFATGVLMFAVAFVPLAAQRPAPAQRGGVPRSDTPQLVVTAFASSDLALGMAASDAIQRRILHRLEPANVTFASGLVDRLVSAGRPARHGALRHAPSVRLRACRLRGSKTSFAP